ncbi:tRNA-splicing ligase RtcB [Planctomycetales bacterium 10988]|nr:tRNA-splicing ligase RtcB [Planctomycetales bacterium 10988]
MNKKQLRELGVPETCLGDAIFAISQGVQEKRFKGKKAGKEIEAVLEQPSTFVNDPVFGTLANKILEEERLDRKYAAAEPATYQTWGKDWDQNSLQQLQEACSLPIAVRGALMPDAHLGYGLPIGGVLATEGAVIPYAVGVDIACRMKISITDLPTDVFKEKPSMIDESLQKGTVFGVGKTWKRRQNHDAMDLDWSVTPLTAQKKDKAWAQLGTSGSGNHFVEWGIVEVPEGEMGLGAGEYVALLSHSGSRGTGAAVCDQYSRIARQQIPSRYRHLDRLGWLSLDSQEGQEYWAAMNLMGDYASANHAVIHRNVLKLAGAEALTGVENHHNFAWKEVHDGREVIVHRKGATPAGEGVLGVIPGSMASPSYIVRGKGNPASLNSSSHGAGRRMSRREAFRRYRWPEWRDHLKKHGVRLLAAGLDEVPGVYKDIRQVMQDQEDLVEIVATFTPKVVMMCGDGSKAED